MPRRWGIFKQIADEMNVGISAVFQGVKRGSPKYMQRYNTLMEQRRAEWIKLQQNLGAAQ